MESAKKLILYRDFKQGRVFEDFAWIMEQCGELCRKGTQEPQCGNPHGEGCPAENISGSREELQSRCNSCLHSLIELSASHGFEGNLWQSYLAFLLVNH